MAFPVIQDSRPLLTAQYISDTDTETQAAFTSVGLPELANLNCNAVTPSQSIYVGIRGGPFTVTSTSRLEILDCKDAAHADGARVLFRQDVTATITGSAGIDGHSPAVTAYSEVVSTTICDGAPVTDISKWLRYGYTDEVATLDNGRLIITSGNGDFPHVLIQRQGATYGMWTQPRAYGLRLTQDAQPISAPPDAMTVIWNCQTASPSLLQLASVHLTEQPYRQRFICNTHNVALRGEPTAPARSGDMFYAQAYLRAPVNPVAGAVNGFVVADLSSQCSDTIVTMPDDGSAWAYIDVWTLDDAPRRAAIRSYRCTLLQGSLTYFFSGAHGFVMAVPPPGYNWTQGNDVFTSEKYRSFDAILTSAGVPVTVASWADGANRGVDFKRQNTDGTWPADSEAVSISTGFIAPATVSIVEMQSGEYRVAVSSLGLEFNTAYFTEWKSADGGVTWSAV